MVQQRGRARGGSNRGAQRSSGSSRQPRASTSTSQTHTNSDTESDQQSKRTRTNDHETMDVNNPAAELAPEDNTITSDR